MDTQFDQLFGQKNTRKQLTCLLIIDKYHYMSIDKKYLPLARIHLLLLNVYTRTYQDIVFRFSFFPVSAYSVQRQDQEQLIEA